MTARSPEPVPRVRVEITSALVRTAVEAILRDAGFELVVSARPGDVTVTTEAGGGDHSHVLVCDASPAACSRAVSALTLGRCGAVVSRDEPDRLPAVVMALIDGAATIPLSVLSSAASAPAPTLRQIEALRHLQQGASTAEISRRLCVSQATAKREISALHRQFGTRTRAELVAAAVEGGYGRRLVAV